MRVFFFFLLFFSLPFPSYAAVSLDGLRECYQNPSELIACGNREIEILLESFNAAELMSLLQEKTPEYMCHQFGHTVGRQVYGKIGSLEQSIESCGGFGCSGACIHGATEAAFLEKLNIDPGSADPHIAESSVFENAASFCSDSTMCHGIGHMLFQLYNTFDVPLMVCEESAKGFAREECYRGVFMDHSMKYSTYNLLLGEKKNRVADTEDLLEPCSTLAAKHRHACYRYQPRLQKQLLDEMEVDDTHERWRLQQEACETLGAADRKACFEGLGLSFFNTALEEASVVDAWSDGLERWSDRTSFNQGLISYMVAHGKRPEALNYCAQKRLLERVPCYYSAWRTFSFIQKW